MYVIMYTYLFYYDSENENNMFFSKLDILLNIKSFCFRYYYHFINIGDVFPSIKQRVQRCHSLVDVTRARVSHLHACVPNTRQFANTHPCTIYGRSMDRKL